ncbi:CAP domain-containing protein [Candidatus Nitrosocosmicus sp. R]
MYNNISVKVIMILVTTAILTVPSSVSQISYSQGDADFQNSILNIHDQERKAVNNPALSWSDSLAADAQSWADHITTLGLGPNDKAPHAPFDINNPQGENLAWGHKDYFTTAAGVDGWAAEKSNYDGQPLTENDFVEGVPMIGHYTQMVWKGTTQIGCGIASDAGQTYLVCRYSPPGNYLGQTPY